MRRSLQRGVTLVEVMFVLAIAAVIFVVGIRQYRSYQHEADKVQLQQDIKSILNGVNQYYQETGCEEVGGVSHSFGQAGVDLMPILIKDKLVKLSNPLLVQQYKAKVIATGVVTHDKWPLYRFEVEADTDPVISPQRFAWLITALDANPQSKFPQLVWTKLPGSDKNEDTAMPGLAAQKNFFRKMESMEDSTSQREQCA